MDTTPLDGYKKLIITILTLIAGSLGLFITDPAKAQTAGQFLIDVLGPVLVVLVGIVYTVVQGNIDKEKAKTAAVEAKAQAVIAQAVSPDASPKAESIVTPQSVSMPMGLAAAPATEVQDTYRPADLDGMVAAATVLAQRDGLKVTPLNTAFYFYPYVTSFDLREVPRGKRIEESLRLANKGLDLYKEAWLWYTKLPTVPDKAKALDPHASMQAIKEEFEKMAGVVCSNQTFEELKDMLGYFKDFYTAIDGLNQLKGKTIDWSIYGSAGNNRFGPLQVGWDYAKLL
jgi:DNA-binding cell septation regulator SpoVG